jgi:hypothetical protein
MANIQPWLQERILSGMIEAGSLSQAEELLAGAEPGVAGGVASELIKQYISKKKEDCTGGGAVAPTGRKQAVPIRRSSRVAGGSWARTVRRPDDHL